MKVIAHSGSNSVLVEAEPAELARVLGYSSLSQLAMAENAMADYYNHAYKKFFPIGREIPINKLWEIVEHERARPGVLKMAADQLRGVIAAIESVNTTLLPSLAPPPDAPKS